MKRYVRPIRETSIEPVSLFVLEEPKKEKKIKEKIKKPIKKPKVNKYQKLSYQEYLKTAYWQKVRKRVIRKYRGKCQKCGYKYARTVHHIKYVERGTENRKLEVLTLLCNFCHMDEHGIDNSIYEPWGGKFKK